MVPWQCSSPSSNHTEKALELVKEWVTWTYTSNVCICCNTGYKVSSDLFFIFHNGMNHLFVYMIITSDHSSAYFPLHQHLTVSSKNCERHSWNTLCNPSCYWGRHASIFLNLHAWREPWVNEEPMLWCVKVVILVLPWLKSCDTDAHEWGWSAVSFQ